MKATTILPFVAITIFPALSQTRTGAIDDIPKSMPLDPRSGLLPYACTQSNILVSDQLAEIKQLQSRNLPIPADLAGYIFAVTNGRRIAGCPAVPLLGDNGSSNSSAATDKAKRSSDPAANGNPCATLRILREQVTEQMEVLREYNIPIPPYLAGWFSLTKDAGKILYVLFGPVLLSSAHTPESRDLTWEKRLPSTPEICYLEGAMLNLKLYVGKTAVDALARTSHGPTRRHCRHRFETCRQLELWATASDSLGRHLWLQ